MILAFVILWVVLFFGLAYVTSMIAGLGVIEVTILAIVTGALARLIVRRLLPRFRRTSP
jgi:hypothetical protein